MHVTVALTLERGLRGQHYLISWQSYIEVFVWILLVFKSFGGHLHDCLSFKDDVSVGLSILGHVLVEHLPRVCLHLLPECMLIPLIRLDRSHLLLQPPQVLIPPLLLSHQSEGFFPLAVPLLATQLGLFPPTVAQQKIVHDVLRTWVYVVLLRHKRFMVILV